jgi:precorrin-6x reductase
MQTIFDWNQHPIAVAQSLGGLLVTKDSGSAGGFDAKLEAAAEEGCRVVVDRAAIGDGLAVASIAEMVRAVKATLGAPVSGDV